MQHRQQQPSSAHDGDGGRAVAGAEQLQHFPGFGSVRTDVAVNELIGVRELIFSQRHSSKIKFIVAKSEWDLFTGRVSG